MSELKDFVKNRFFLSRMRFHGFRINQYVPTACSWCEREAIANLTWNLGLTNRPICKKHRTEFMRAYDKIQAGEKE